MKPPKLFFTQNLKKTNKHISQIPIQFKRLLKGWLCIGMLVLAGCDNSSSQSQSQSMFERQTQEDNIGNSDDNTIDIEPSVRSQVSNTGDTNISDTKDLLLFFDVTSKLASKASQSPSLPKDIKVSINHLTAKNPLCQQDASHDGFDNNEDCQYFELNTLDFSPQQPWLTSIMWQTIASIVNPEMPLASHEGEAKDTVFTMVNKIEYGDKTAVHLPKYQHIMTGFSPNNNHTGYLSIVSTQQRSSMTPKLQNVYYMMVDIDRKIRLSLDDILLPNHHPEELLAIIQEAGADVQIEQGAETMQRLPVHLAQQWYLDDHGLHFIYQPGEAIIGIDILDTSDADITDGIMAVSQPTSSQDIDTHANLMPIMVEIIIPYSLLSDIIKPQYLITTTNSTNQPSESKDVIIIKSVDPTALISTHEITKEDD